MDYQLNKIIGQGTYGIVYSASHIETGETFAIKKLYKKFKTVQEYINLNEIQFLTQFSHKNIIQLKDIFLEKEELYIVFEQMEQNLYQFYSRQKKKKRIIPEPFIAKIIKQILQGIDYMHQKGYFHRDLKPENILISKDIVKICDFGQIKSIYSLPPFTEYTATRWYRSPEQILMEGQYSYPVDIFAIGTIMAELYNQKPIFQGKSQLDQINQICSILGSPCEDQNDYYSQNKLTKDSIQFPKQLPIPLENIIQNACPEAIDLMRQIFKLNPNIRPSAEQLLKHEYFQKFQIFDEINKSKTIFKISVKTKIPQNIQIEYSEEQIKLLSMSSEPKHRNLIQYKNTVEKPKKNIFLQDKNFKILNDGNLYNSKILGFKQNIINNEKANMVFPKIMIKNRNNF